MNLISYQPLFSIENFLNKMKLFSSDDCSDIFTESRGEKKYLVNAVFPRVNKEDINISVENCIYK